jgi:glutathione peroxidase|tara:strand:+ start:234 stop:653 length:420 start_codon:yes stop_codon:yes gene_type:complete
MTDKLLELNLESLRLGLLSSDRHYGKPLLIFNSASFCGYTKQLLSMQKIHEEGRVVPIALPTNEFGDQEPGDDIEISQYYQNKFGITFPVIKKTNLEHILFKTYGKPDWNFNKYLFDSKHNFVDRYDSKTLPEDVIKDV